MSSAKKRGSKKRGTERRFVPVEEANKQLPTQWREILALVREELRRAGLLFRSQEIVDLLELLQSLFEGSRLVGLFASHHQVADDLGSFDRCTRLVEVMRQLRGDRLRPTARFE